MKLFRNLALFAFVFYCANTFAQTSQKYVSYDTKGNTYKELPVDLDVEKVIFLEYEQIPIDPTTPKQIQKMHKRRNDKYFPAANEQLHDNIKKYPFEYIISKRSELENLDGYKYVYECELMRLYNNGVNLYAGSDSNYKVQQRDGSYKSMKAEYVANMYIIDRTTGDRYKVFKMDQDYAMYYKGIINKLVKKIEKQYGF